MFQFGNAILALTWHTGLRINFNYVFLDESFFKHFPVHSVVKATGFVN